MNEITEAEMLRQLRELKAALLLLLDVHVGESPDGFKFVRMGATPWSWQDELYAEAWLTVDRLVKS